ncbi:terminase small subunit [Chitinophaga sp. GCM10012297]|uniref:Terminase small subunit n=1 Tax=Chitinophaga chungangae TaxID=2821488 RepID=A0ABS3YB73_9BACT|nr:terminase small subunit [Chitinophaga chungangae]MBO9151917.1 terminase small subunit [Chitinophaga chungangae]
MAKKVTAKKEAAAPADKPLSIKERLFADRFLIHGIGRQAAIEAGYKDGAGTMVVASRLLDKPNIKAYLEARTTKIFDKLELTQERVMKEYARIALSDIRAYFTTEGELKPLHELDDDAAAALSSVETDELFEGHGDLRHQVGVTRKIKMWDKKGALDSICKVMGWNAPEKKELTGKDGTPLIPQPDLSKLTDEELRVMAQIKRKLNVEHI